MNSHHHRLVLSFPSISQVVSSKMHPVVTLNSRCKGIEAQSLESDSSQTPPPQPLHKDDLVDVSYMIESLEQSLRLTHPHGALDQHSHLIVVAGLVLGMKFGPEDLIEESVAQGMSLVKFRV